MKIEHMQEHLSKATKRPWWISDENGDIMAGDPGDAVEVGQIDMSGEDIYAMVIAINHVDALMALRRACRKATAHGWRPTEVIDALNKLDAIE